MNNEDNYFSPTAVPTAAPTAVPPAAQEPESGADLVTTLTEAVAKAEEEGSTVSVEVVGAQEVLSAQEYTELRKLPAQEQILVTLSSIGFDEVVEAAMSTLNVTLSDQASGLMTQVGARMQSANEQDKAALEEKLARYFPTKEVVVGGVRSTYFIIDLRIEVDGVARIQRYGFQLDENGEWIFVELSVEEA